MLSPELERLPQVLHVRSQFHFQCLVVLLISGVLALTSFNANSAGISGSLGSADSVEDLTLSHVAPLTFNRELLFGSDPVLERSSVCGELETSEMGNLALFRGGMPESQPS